MKNLLKSNKIKLIIGLVFLIIFSLVVINFSSPLKIDYVDFIDKVENNKIEKVFLTETSNIKFKELGSEKIFKTSNPQTENFKEYLLLNNIEVKENQIVGVSIIQSVFSFSLLLGILFFIYKTHSKQNDKNSRVFKPSLESNIFFKDIAGNEEAKENAKDIIDFLKNPEKYKKLGARIPRGIIFHGSPGTGKTLMARAIANEANVPFYSVCGSDFVEMYVGVGAKRIRELFKEARKNEKAVIFIDEIDALGKKRNLNTSGANEEREQTLNALLSEISGFSEDDKIVIIGTTNRLDTLDSALTRAGRFDRHIEIGLPDLSDRKKIIELHLKDKPFDSNISLEEISKKTVYFSGAMLESLINEAAIFAAKDFSEKILNSHIEKAFFKIVAGDEKKDKSSILEQDKKITAFHEAGHALVTKILDKDITISKISIIPSNKGAGGFCINIFKDKMFYTKKDLENQIMISYAGRVAEEVIFGKENITTGAYNDIEKASKIILEYVGKYSMNNNILLNPEIVKISNEKLQKEYENLSLKLYNKTKDILLENINLLNKLASNLLLNESLNEKEINQILN